ncbi:hypothetical protein N7449_008514 [Penicillium cf. viridicatum]|uniref:Uncharacterized protein n=1 Tax=Penicillium cf. viridicatum TaxID=2972119 RepID=A0A9W9JA72_9EURO|nr:hypothetical protein N7449_008514 [Penicillium cf. viridicatum]
MRDTSVYGIATDSFHWEFIQIRGNREPADIGGKNERLKSSLFTKLLKPRHIHPPSNPNRSARDGEKVATV